MISPTASGDELSLAATAELETSEAIFQGLAARTPLVVFVNDAAGNWIHVNERWCELAGLTPAESIGDGWAAAVHPDDRERVRGEWAEAVRTGNAMIVDYRLLRADGGISWLQGFASALHDDYGEVSGWVGSCLDVTTRRRAEEAATESCARFQAAFESAPTGVALAALDGSWLDVNDALCKLTGYTKDELLALTFAEITHPDDRAASHEDWLRHNAGTGDGSRLEKRYVRADGEIVWVGVSRMLVHDTDGRPPFTVAHIEDITGRRGGAALARRGRGALPARLRRRAYRHGARRARRELAARERVTLRDPRLRRADPGLAGTFPDLTHPDDQEVSSASVRGLLEGRCRSFTHEKRYVRRDGSLVWAMLSVSLAKDASGVPLYMVSQIENVDERKLAEGKMADLLELEREQVERLQALDRMKDEFVASVSHELRTPLTSIQGYLELVLDGEAGDLNEEQRGHLATVSRNSDRLLRLVGDLLLVAQTDAGQLDLVLDEVDLGNARARVHGVGAPAGRGEADPARGIGRRAPAGPPAIEPGSRS